MPGTTRLRAGLVALALGVAVVVAGCSADSTAPRSSSAAPGIGAWPTFLPSPSEQGVVTGTLDDPAMSYPGNAVLVRVGDASALVDVEGPSYPASTKVGAEQVRCTFTVTISKVTAPISLRAASFSVLDGQGGLHAFTPASGSTVPAQLEPGHATTLSLVGVVPAGEGLFRFYPSTAGAVAAWDYVAETD